MQNNEIVITLEKERFNVFIRFNSFLFTALQLIPQNDEPEKKVL